VRRERFKGRRVHVKYHRVSVGEFHERDGAESLARQLARDGRQGFVLLGAAASP
jgi:hypothetical protein